MRDEWSILFDGWKEFARAEAQRRRFAAAKGDARRAALAKERSARDIALDWSPYVPWKEEGNG